MIYDVEVKRQGSPIAHHIVEAVNALTAINLVESIYGELVRYEVASIEDETIGAEGIQFVLGWCFLLRQVADKLLVFPDRLFFYINDGWLDKLNISSFSQLQSGFA